MIVSSIDINLKQVAAGVVTAILLYIVGVFIYSLYFHPLAKFPGPKLAAVTEIWFVKSWLGGRHAFDLQKLHEHYGKIVRIGYNQLSFIGVQSYEDIYGHAKKDHEPFLKTDLYEIPGENEKADDIVGTRDPERHKLVRKTLSHAFSAKALRAQTDIVVHYVDMFMDQITKLGQGEEGIDMSEWFNWLTFDIIGDLIFGESFNAVSEAKSSFWVDFILNSLYVGSLLNMTRRVRILAVLLPFYVSRSLIEKRNRQLQMTKDKVARRLAKPNDRDDIFAHILSNKQIPAYEAFIFSNSQTLTIAGSETTANPLTAAVHYLSENKTALERLQEEVRGAFKTKEDIDGDSAAELPYLNAVIEESLRIFTPVPFGLPRYSPGAVIDGVWIPKGTIVSTHTFTASLSPLYFRTPLSFHPERFLPPSHRYYDRDFASDVLDAFKPFSLGPRNCIGINLAYLELRIVIARLVWEFDWVRVEKEGKGGDGEGENGKVDWQKMWWDGLRTETLWKRPKVVVRFSPVVR